MSSDSQEDSGSARLLYEPLALEHAGPLFHALSSGEIYRFIPQEPYESVTLLEARIRRVVVGRSADGEEKWLNWAVRERASGAVIGRIEATLRDDVADVAYLLDPNYWRRGYGAEAIAWLVQTLTKCHGVKLLCATIDRRNLASMALVSKIGFVWVRSNPAADQFKGEVSDEAVFQLASTQFNTLG